jgi:hypothetical protein
VKDSKNFSYAGKDLVIFPVNIMIEEATSTLSGFKLTPPEVEVLIEHYSTTPMVIPSERVVVYSFTTAVAEGGLNCVLNVPMIHTTGSIILFPRLATDLTVFFNPMLRNLHIRFGNRVYPERGAQTNTHEFLKQMIENAYLDGPFQPTESFERSYIDPVSSASPYRDRSGVDNTCFMHIVNLERQGATAFFFNSYHNPNGETLNMSAGPIQTGVNNTYLLNHRHAQTETRRNNTPPYVCLINDTFWLLSSKKPAVYETQKEWNEVFSSHYPELYNQLAAEAGLINPFNTYGHQHLGSLGN